MPRHISPASVAATHQHCTVVLLHPRNSLELILCCRKLLMVASRNVLTNNCTYTSRSVQLLIDHILKATTAKGFFVLQVLRYGSVPKAVWSYDTGLLCEITFIFRVEDSSILKMEAAGPSKTSVLSRILVTWQVMNGFWIRSNNLLDIHQVELQLVVTQSYCNYNTS
jgi:hypothetical protein